MPVIQNIHRITVDVFTFAGQAQRAGIALEQRYTKLRLKGADRFAQCRLADKELFCGLCKAFLLHNTHKIF